MPVVITGIGTAVPPHQIAQDIAARGTVPFCCETPEQGRLLEGLFRRSGVQTRHSVLLQQSAGTMAECQDFYAPRSETVPRGPTTAERMAYFEQAAGEFAVSAASRALERSGVDARRVTHLITVTCSGFSAPGFDCTLIRDLPLKATVSRTQLGFMGCHAALNAIRVARAFVAAEPQSVVLICCVELCTLHYQYGWDPEQIVAMSLFSDGAAACVVQSTDSNISPTGWPGLERTREAPESFGSRSAPATLDAGSVGAVRSRIRENSDTPTVDHPKSHDFGYSVGADVGSIRHEQAPYRILANGALVMQDCADAMTWRMSDHGFRMTLSPRVPDLLARHLLPWLMEWLGSHGYRPEDIGSWAVHPGGPRILQAFTDATHLDPKVVQASRDILRRYGNMSSPTLLFILEALQTSSATRPTVAIGFGPGLAVEAALFG